MASSSGSLASLPSATARGIALAGWVLIVLFLTILSASLLPVRLLDAAWQLRVGGVLINAAPFPLIGLSSDIRFWSSGDTKTGPPDGLLTGALRRPLDRCFIGGCRVVVVGCGICAA